MQKFQISENSTLKPSIAAAFFLLQSQDSFSGNLLVCDISANSAISVCCVEGDRITTLYSTPLPQVCGELAAMLRVVRSHYDQSKVNRALQQYLQYPDLLATKRLMLLENDRIITCGEVDRLFHPFQIEIASALESVRSWTIDKVFLLGEFATFHLVTNTINQFSQQHTVTDNSTIGIRLETFTPDFQKTTQDIELLRKGVWVDDSIALLEDGQVSTFGKDISIKAWRKLEI